MITAEKAHAMFLTMPVVREEDLTGHKDFRLNEKLFGSLWPVAGFATLKVGKEEMQMLATRAKIFSIPKGGERGGWVNAKLALVSEEEFLELVWKAWRNTAPPRLSLQY